MSNSIQLNVYKVFKTIFIILILHCCAYASSIAKLEVFPRPVELSVGDTVNLKVIGRAEDGSILPLLYPLWSVEPQELGRFSSINSPEISFTAEKKGKGKLIIIYGDVKSEQEIIVYDTLPPYNDIWPPRSQK
jgi:hypothetical protein